MNMLSEKRHLDPHVLVHAGPAGQAEEEAADEGEPVLLEPVHVHHEAPLLVLHGPCSRFLGGKVRPETS